MKIAVITQKFVNYGGAEQFVSEYTTHLANTGHEIHIFANQWAQSNHPNIRVRHVRAIQLNSFLRTLSFAWFALQAVRSESFDIVQSHERIWRQDLYRAGDGCHREWLERRACYLPFVKRLYLRFNLFHQLVLKPFQHCKQLVFGTLSIVY